MSGLPWFRMYVDFLDDPKMIGLAFEDQRHFIGLLALKSAGTLDNEAGSALLDRIVAQKLWIDHAIIREVKKRLVDASLIDENWQPVAWDRRQRRSDHDVSGAERQARHREKKAAERASEERNASRNEGSNGAVTPPDREEEKEEEKEETTSSVSPAAKPSPASPLRMSAEDHRRVIALYHELLPELTPVVLSRWPDSAHAKQLAARWREDPRFRSERFWRDFFAIVRDNDWWMGRSEGSDGKPWTGCKLAWLVKRSNFDKVLESGGFR